MEYLYIGKIVNTHGIKGEVRILSDLTKMQKQCDKCIEEFRTDFETKKDAAIYFKTCKYPHVLFAMYNKKDYSRVIWDIIKKYSKFDS